MEGEVFREWGVQRMERGPPGNGASKEWGVLGVGLFKEWGARREELVVHCCV